jgi:hypothetical protein
MSRPDYIKCIAAQDQHNIGQALCGRRIGGHKLVEHPECGPIKVLVPSDFCFQDLDHWYLNAVARQRLQGCPECLAKVQEALSKELAR